MNLGEPYVFHFPQAIVLIDLYSLFYSLCFWSGPWKHLNLRRALFLCSTISFYPCKSLRFMNSCPGIINYLYPKFKHISLKKFILKNVFGLKLRPLVLKIIFFLSFEKVLWVKIFLRFYQGLWTRFWDLLFVHEQQLSSWTSNLFPLRKLGVVVGVTDVIFFSLVNIKRWVLG